MTTQERIPPIIYQLTLTANKPQDLELAKAVLLSAGLSSSEISDDLRLSKPSLRIFNENVMFIKKYDQLFWKLALPGIKSTVTQLKPKDWLTRWKDDWKPARLTKSLDVVPLWYQVRYKVKPKRDYILMDTLLSFGTGLHETTQIMAQFIEDQRGRYKSFLDIGTGTGILAMVALKHGAKDVTAIDIGQLSIKAAEDNMKVNKLKFTLKLADIKKYKTKKKYDYVAANLITQDLIDNARQIVGCVKPGGILAVSGISLDNLARLTKAFKQLPLQLLDTVKGKQWSGQLYVKKMF